MRGWQLPNCCFLCGCEEENVNHILLHCTVVRTLWEIAFALFGVQWVFPEKVKEALPFCGEKKEEDMEVHSVMYFLDGVEGKK